MKTQILTTVLILLSLGLFAQVGINTDNSTPDGSAMLDVKSTTQGMLIPRMTSDQRTNISSPATGLLVFDETTGGFWFYNATAWVSLNGSTANIPDAIADADNNTKVQVDKGGLDDDIIRFDMAGTEFFRMDSGRIEVLNTGNSVFIGNAAGGNDDFTNNENVAIGDSALFSNGEGEYNTAVGYQSLFTNSSGFRNTAVGHMALKSNTTGKYNAAVGDNALQNNTSGEDNIAIGQAALWKNSTGMGNIAFGYSNNFNTVGGFNFSAGFYAMATNESGSHNVAIGQQALYYNKGNNNIGLGSSVLFSNTTGEYNIALGSNAQNTNTTGSYNTTIGAEANVSYNNLTNATAIGANAMVSQDSSLVLGNEVNVGIGTSSPNNSAKVEISSTTQGFLPPRMTQAQRDGILSPAEGLLIYQTDAPVGFYYFKSGVWTSLSQTTTSTAQVATPVLTICCQSWMTTNLDVDSYRNGDPIPHVTDPTVWAALTRGAYCDYNNDSATYAAVYGKLYNWYAVNDPRGLAPEGWHVPTHFEWTTLTDCLGGASVAGGAMKETGTTHWSSPNTDATNISGFTGLPGGVRFGNGTFSLIGSIGFWWSSTEGSSSSAWNRSLNYDYGLVNEGYYNELYGSSVRCIRD
jgi:uncharacterized protein (TIGR02145 family)